MYRIGFRLVLVTLVLLVVPGSEAGKLYFSGVDSARRVNQNGTGNEFLLDDIPGPVYVALDPVDGKMYWNDTSSGVFRANHDGSGVENLHVDSQASSVVLDTLARKVYWFRPDGQMLRANLDGSFIEPLFVDTTLDLGPEIDPINGHLYWSSPDEGKIYRSALDGSFKMAIADTTDPLGIGLDLQNGKIYWCDGGSDSIRRADLDGGNAETVIVDEDRPADVLVDNAEGKIYWLVRFTGSRPIRRANLDGSGVEKIQRIFTAGQSQSLSLGSSTSCGDGVLDPFEDCDDYNNVDADGCQADCTFPACGDGVVDAAEGEECDDGNDAECDGCTFFCILEEGIVCGDGIVSQSCGEECDDGNTMDGDECSSECEMTLITPEGWEEFKLLPPDGQSVDQFGSSVAMDDGVALIGAPGTDGPGSDAGTVVRYARSGPGWEFQSILSPSDPVPNGRFGGSVAIDGDTALIGSRPGSPTLGAAYVFTGTQDMWHQQAKLLPADLTWWMKFGAPVAVDGDTAVVGANRDDALGNDSGSVYVFARSESGWTQQAKLLASDGAQGDSFGSAVAIAGDTLFVGAPRVDGTEIYEGRVYVFERTESGWVERAELEPPRPIFQSFGASVAIDPENPDRVLIGAPFGEFNDIRSGAAYVFARVDGQWIEQVELLPSDPDLLQRFGTSVAIAGDKLLVGAPYPDGGKGFPAGAAYVFDRSEGAWVERVKLQASNGTSWNRFGTSVDFDGVTALVGAPNNGPSGAVYSYGPPADAVPTTNIFAGALLCLAVLISGSYLIWRRASSSAGRYSDSSTP